MNAPLYSQQTLVILSIDFGGSFIPISRVPATEGAVKYLDSIKPTAEQIILRRGGSLIDDLKSDLTAAWPVSDSGNGASAIEAAVEIAQILSQLIGEGTQRGYPGKEISIGLSRGPCAVLLRNNRIANVVGQSLNLAWRMRKNARDSTVPLAFDHTLAELASHFEVKEIAPGVFSIPIIGKSR
jgi:hypothetical protein